MYKSSLILKLSPFFKNNYCLMNTSTDRETGFIPGSVVGSGAGLVPEATPTGTEEGH